MNADELMRAADRAFKTGRVEVVDGFMVVPDIERRSSVFATLNGRTVSLVPIEPPACQHCGAPT